MNMTEQDWERVLEEQGESFRALVDSPEEPVSETKHLYPNGLPKPPNPSKEPQLFTFIRIEKTTPKAKFYVTHETMTEIHGFWCPNAAATMRETDVVEVAHWCKIKIIQFI